MKFKLVITASALSAIISTEGFAQTTLTCPTIPVKKCTVNPQAPLPSLSQGCTVTNTGNAPFQNSTLNINWPDQNKDNIGAMWMANVPNLPPNHSGADRNNGIISTGSPTASLSEEGAPICTYNFTFWEQGGPTQGINLTWGDKSVKGCGISSDNPIVFTCPPIPQK